MKHALSLSLSVLLLTAAPAVTQQADDAPTIAVTASGTVELVADHAVLILGVEVHDSMASGAARKMDRRLAAVADTLESLGFPWDSLPNAGYAITPQRNRDAAPGEIAGHRAQSSVRVTVRALDRLPDVIMAALTAGANSVRRLEFRSSETEAARQDALAEAVASARRDAETLADAAGVRLEAIREIRTGGDPRSSLSFSRVAAASRIGGQSITPRSITVRAEVEVIWRTRSR